MNKMLRMITAEWLEQNDTRAIWVNVHTGEWATLTDDESCQLASGVFGRDSGTFVQRYIEVLVDDGAIVEEDRDFEAWQGDGSSLRVSDIVLADSESSEEIKIQILSDRQGAARKRLIDNLPTHESKKAEEW